MGLGETWRVIRGWGAVPDVERGLETAVTAAATDSSNGAKAAAAPPRKEPNLPKLRAAASSKNLLPQSEPCRQQLHRFATVTTKLFLEMIRSLTIYLHLWQIVKFNWR